MDPESQVSDYSMTKYDFLVLVLFTRRSHMPTYNKSFEESVIDHRSSHGGTTLEVANWVWLDLDIMHDLSALSYNSPHDVESNLVSDKIIKDVGDLLMSQSSFIVDSLVDSESTLHIFS